MSNTTPSTPRPTNATQRSPKRTGSHGRRDGGDTLLEIMLTVMIIGVTVTALMSSLANAGNAGNIQRNGVQTDVVMRNYAEATKSAVQACVPGGSYTVAYTPPARWVVATTPAGALCPALTSTVLLTLDVSAPLGAHQTMQIRIRTP